MIPSGTKQNLCLGFTAWKVAVSLLLLVAIGISVGLGVGLTSGSGKKSSSGQQGTDVPTLQPTLAPSSPSVNPTVAPSLKPTVVPSLNPTAPTLKPTIAPTRPTSQPSTSSLVDYSCLQKDSWRVNTASKTSSLFSSALVDIVSSAYSSSNSWKVSFYGIVDYDRVFTSADISTLNSRPKASTDFPTGATTATAGPTIKWGQNIGFKTQSCSLGYWPPGPSCPTATAKSYTFSLQPAPETSGSHCSFPFAGAGGYYVNGASIFGYSDVQSYNSGGVWYNNAPEFEGYDVDICNGHAANGEYHHHHYPRCLGEKLGDDGTLSHSKVWGWAFDNYPIYGPYQGVGILAVSCWMARDYSSSLTGCSGGGRTCTLNDQYDYTKGTTTLTNSKFGPSPSGTVTTLSSNTISAASGIYFQDMYFNYTCKAQNGRYLDEFNGHSHGSYGYHYHITIDSAGKAKFPYIMGPKYYGCCTASKCSCSSSTCGTTTGVALSNAQCIT